MDITPLFRSTVKEKRKQVKALGGSVSDTDLFHKSKEKCPCITKFKDLVEQISKLRDFLLDKRKSYMNLSPVNLINNDDMTEFDRDKVDNQAQHIIKTCTQLISSYKKETYNFDEENQAIENRRAILDLIEAYLKAVCKIYTEQKAIRVKLTVELQKMSKLTQGNLDFKENNSLAETKERDKSKSQIEIEDKKVIDSERLHYSTFAAVNATEENTLSGEELQMFEMENEQLYNELNSLNDEVKDIQSKVIKIAELQEVFTEKVMEQSDEIERISTTLVGTTENLKDANVQIRQAIQSNASLRIYLLFFLLVMSFSLLFLDWYND
ncbi:syntaxin-18 [Halyomorpha halys]|uniref:syntaxin-18 n=1 Tax=Halyomorpha halys TaxID=286706 RepID=UPI0006D4F611|nr:syntaxin-18 [Halyomorpha halys]